MKHRLSKFSVAILISLVVGTVLLLLVNPFGSSVIALPLPSPPAASGSAPAMVVHAAPARSLHHHDWLDDGSQRAGGAGPTNSTFYGDGE